MSDGWFQEVTKIVGSTILLFFRKMLGVGSNTVQSADKHFEEYWLHYKSWTNLSAESTEMKLILTLQSKQSAVSNWSDAFVQHNHTNLSAHVQRTLLQPYQNSDTQWWTYSVCLSIFQSIPQWTCLLLQGSIYHFSSFFRIFFSSSQFLRVSQIPFWNSGIVWPTAVT